MFDLAEDLDSSLSSCGTSRLQPSLVEEFGLGETTPTNATGCDDNCPTSIALRERIAALEAENKTLKQELALHQVPGYPEYYNITYDVDTAVYVFKLLKDFSKGDLKILVQ
ncbi:hypothetical protein DPMN_100044 [Dreissena polymorpha]|uniref:Uncharacterized protein n=1 Tax=Dreissena polymorpha TaxID=45954 RepID=A0A9D4LF21_DREPO|nr:hypothetical protein DPMN_100044 [Dreissena polymorpha]